MRVFVHSGDEYVASVDPESLQLLTYLRLAKRQNDLTIVFTCKTWATPTGTLPVLEADGPTSLHSGAENIILQLKNMWEDVDQGILNEVQLAEVTAYAAMLTDRLRLAMVYLHWLDGKNYTEVMRKWYGRMTVFPFSLVVLSRMHRRARHSVMAGLPLDMPLEQRGIELLNQAEKCLDLLSARLGDGSWFFDSGPSSLDAMVFGYLELISQFQLPGNNCLQRKLHSHGNLTRFCDQMRQLCFPEKEKRPMLITGSPIGPSVALWRDPAVWLCAGIVVTVLVVQGVRVGLVNIVSRKWRHWSWQQSYLSSSKDRDQLTHHDGGSDVD